MTTARLGNYAKRCESGESRNWPGFEAAAGKRDIVFVIERSADGKAALLLFRKGGIVNAMLTIE
jgi:hypothetical protein